MAEPIHFIVEKAEEREQGVQLKEIQDRTYYSEEYFKTIVESSFNGIAVTDEQGNFEYVNDSFLKMVDWPKEELIGQNFIKIIPEDTHELALKLCNDVQKGANNSHEIKIKTGKGELKYLNSIHKLTKINGKIKTISITEDITGKKELERELRESEAKYRELFENASDIIYTGNAEGYILDANNATIRALGCTAKEEVIGTHASIWLTPESAKIGQENLRKYFQGETMKQPAIIEAVTKNGEHKWVEIRSRPIKKDDKIIGVQAIARDITEKRKLEQKLKESEAKYRELFENANDAIFTSDAKGYITTANKAMVKGFGCNSKDEVIGTHFTDCLTPECIQDASEHMRKYLSGEPVKQPVIREVICKNGEHKWVEVICRTIKDGDRVIGLHCTARDITEKIKMQRELKESEAKYRELFENAQDAMYVLDTKANFLKMNQVGLRILGCTKEEVIGTNISKWLTQESLKITTNRRKKWNSGETVDDIDILEIVSKNGEHHWVEIKTRHIKDGDRTIEIHGIARDVTENMRLKQELKNSNKQRKLLCYLIKGTRGGKTRTLILRHLIERSYNAHQLTKTLGMDYKTVRHHLGILVKNGIVTKDNGRRTVLYFISKKIESELNEFNSELRHNKS